MTTPVNWHVRYCISCTFMVKEKMVCLRKYYYFLHSENWQIKYKDDKINICWKSKIEHKIAAMLVISNGGGHVTVEDISTYNKKKRN